MTLHPHAIGPVPEETARIAHTACPKGNPSLQMRDLLGTLYDDQLCAALFPPQGQPALARLSPSPSQYHAVCAISLSDRQAAEAVRIRIDWKYALNLEREPIPVLITPSYANFAPACWLGMLSSCSLRRCWTSSKPTDCSKGVGTNVPIRPTSWPPFAPSTAWNVWERRCVTRSNLWLWWHLLGCFVPVRPEWKDRYEQRIQEYRLPESQG